MAGRSAGFGNENLSFLRIFQISGFLPIPLKNGTFYEALTYSGFGIIGILIGISLLRYFLFPNTIPIMDFSFYFTVCFYVFVVITAILKQAKYKSVLR